MSYKLTLDSKDKIVNVSVDCLLDNSIRMEILNEVSNQFNLNNYTRAIIDLRESRFNPSEPIKGAVDLTIYLNKIRMNQDAKLAFIYVDAETHRKTFEQISQKFRYQVRYFKSIDEAYSWFRGS